MKNRNGVLVHKRIRNLILILSISLMYISFLFHQSLMLWWGLLLINSYALILMKRDKEYARRKDSFRIPESTFYLLGLCFGSPAILLGMIFYHHKTKHISFKLIPILMPLQVIFLFWIKSLYS
jgi:uncharacterized membrane protein YsdA (DUF1294 family)